MSEHDAALAPYQSPGTTPDARPKKPTATLRTSGASMMGLALLVAMVGLVTGFLVWWLPVLFFAVAGGLSAVAAVRGARSLFEVVMGTRRDDPPRAWMSALVIPLGLLGAAFGGLVTLGLALGTAVRGRQLRLWSGRRVYATVTHGARGWSSERPPVDAPAAVAAAWRTNGLTEHASVAAFARLAIELMELGAPASLVAAAHSDAQDELRHTQLCFSLARAIDGRNLEPQAVQVPPARYRWAPRSLRLAHLAVESVVDGALNEGMSARVLAALGKADGLLPEARAVVTDIARDEARHAAHAQHVVRWCLEEGGTPVAHAVAAAVARLPQQAGPSPHPAAADGQWERFGLPSRAREEAAFAAEKDRLIRRFRRPAERPVRPIAHA